MRPVRLVSLILVLGLGLGAPAAFAQGKGKAPAAQKGKAPPKEEAKADTPDESDAAPAPDTEVKAAGTGAAAKEAKAEKTSKANVVEESADKEGVKTYKFKAVEVEGRLKSPQIIYFLRRVRAEFDAGLLGHRSFMPELSDSRRSPSLK